MNINSDQRYKELNFILRDDKCFKIICGAGNEDKNKVKKLALIYTLAGANMIDVSANVGVVKSANEGIKLAYEKCKNFEIDIKTKPYIMISVGMPGDHHVRKSYIDPQTCIACALCAPVCPTNAIPYDFHEKLDFYKSLGGTYDIECQSKEIVIKSLCIGCGKCSNICPKSNIISYRHDKKALKRILPECIEAGAECIELHAGIDDDNIFIKEWALINEINQNNFNSLCLDRLNLGNFNLENRIKKAKEISGNKLIIQADGYPMSGGTDDYNTTLQAVACADVVNKKFNVKIHRKKDKIRKKLDINTKKSLRRKVDKNFVYVIISGGTNSLSKKLARQCNINVNGIAIGTYARNIVEEFLSKEDFYEDDINLLNAVKVAKKLIDANIE